MATTKKDTEGAPEVPEVETDAEGSTGPKRGWTGPVSGVQVPKQRRAALLVPVHGIGPYAPRRAGRIVHGEIECRRMYKEGHITKTELEAKLKLLKLLPDQLYGQNLYLLRGDPDLPLAEQSDVILGIPSVAFKAAMVRATQAVMPEVPMTYMRQMFSVASDPEDMTGYELVRVEPGAKTYRRISLTKNGGQWYHTELVDWRANLTIVYPPDLIRPEQLLALLDHAGNFIGIGAHRPAGANSTGSKGRFEIEVAQDAGEPVHRTPEKRAADAAGRDRRQQLAGALGK